MKKFLFPAVLSLAAAVTLNAAVVATVDGDAINDSDISALLSAAMPGFDASKLQPNEKKRIIDDLINRKLLLKDAKATGIEKDVDYIKAVKAAQEGIAVELYMRKLFDGIKVSDSDLRDFYNKNKASMNQPAQARARHILVEDEKTANDIIAQLKNLKGEALTKKFAELASQKSIDKGSAAHGGELGWFGQSQMVKPFADAAFALKKGEVTQKPVKSNFGYHVILKEDSKAAGTVGLNEVKPQIEGSIKMEKFRNDIKKRGDELRSKAKVEYK